MWGTTSSNKSLRVAIKGTVNGTTPPTNNAPTFSSTTAARSVAENTAAGQNVGAVLTATDADSSDTLTYTLEGSQGHGALDDTSFDYDGSPFTVEAVEIRQPGGSMHGGGLWRLVLSASVDDIGSDVERDGGAAPDGDAGGLPGQP